MNVHQITIRTPDGEEHTFPCAESGYILDAAEEAGLDLPWSCRAGVCSTCTCRKLSGEMDQSEQGYLDDDQAAEGYVLICIGRPLSDVVLESHKTDEVA